MWRRLRTLPAQLLVLVILPLTLMLLLVAFGGAAVHTDAMREMVAVRNERAVRAASEWLAGRLAAGESPEQLLAAADDWLNRGQGASGAAVALLIDEEGRVVAHSGPALLDADYSRHPGVVAVLRGEAGWTFARHLETGEEAVVAYSPVGDTGWGLMVEEPWSAIASPLLRYSQVAPLVLVPAFLLAGGALYFGVRQVVQPLQRLDAQAARLGWGEFDALTDPVGGIEEIHALQATLVRMAAQLQAAQMAMRSYAAAITQGQEEERARLARELHDETVQTLIALEHQAHMLRRVADRDPSAAEKADDLARLAAQASMDLRRVIRALRPPYLDDLGWLPAVRALVAELDGGEGLSASFEVTGTERRLEPGVELALYRIAQEALNNVLRHSEASRVDVQVDMAQDSVALTISDDGRGFSPPARPEQLAAAGHLGLMGMRERAQIIGAQLRFESAPGEGTRVEIRI